MQDGGRCRVCMKLRSPSSRLKVAAGASEPKPWTRLSETYILRQLTIKLCFTLVALVAVVPAAYSQEPSAPTCTLATPEPPLVRANGESELLEDVFLTCVSTQPSVSVLIDVDLILNTNLTSRITNPETMATEALLLIDDPKPGVANTSNGYPYFGQVRGTPGILAGSMGSGNVYQATQVMGGGGGCCETNAGLILNTMVAWRGVPYVTGGTRTFRLTNIRANVASLGSSSVTALVNISPTTSVTIANPQIVVARGAEALHFTSVPLKGVVGLKLSFAEAFPNAFKKRIENTIGGPLTVKNQDLPGEAFCSESGFTPRFASPISGAIGKADTGVRLLARITGIPPGVSTLSSPKQVLSSAGDLIANLILPPFGSNFAEGTTTNGKGDGVVSVSAGHTAELLYDVTGAPPYAGKDGCQHLDTFNISVVPSSPVALTSVVVTGQLAPVDPASDASSTAPEPRFRP
jgi:hypothetical protein